jgi:serine phosphatase RsbU (regulator of sigma subunit)
MAGIIGQDGASGKMACLCAGGEPPLMLRAGGAIETVRVNGPALGCFPKQTYTAAMLRLETRDVVLLATDGLTEARRPVPNALAQSRGYSFLGLEGLAQLTRQHQTRRHGCVRSARRSSREPAAQFCN